MPATVASAEGAFLPPAASSFNDPARDEIFREDCEASRTRGKGAVSVDDLLEKGWTLPEIGRRIPEAVKAWQRRRDEVTTAAITAPLVAGAIAAAPLLFALLALCFAGDLTLKGA